MAEDINESFENEDQADGIIFDDDPDPDWDNVKWDEDEEDASFGDDESDDESDEEETNPAEETESAPAETGEAEPESGSDEEGNQFLELKHFDEIRKVNREEAKELAQKGLDYDHVRGERDALRKDMTRYKAMEDFLNEIRGDQFASIDELMDDTRARVMQDKEGISYDDALEKVRGARTTSVQQEEPAQPTTHAAVDAFVQRFPGVKAEDIPQSVWDEVRETGDLAGAYAKYSESKKDERIKALEAEIETYRQNEKNRNRSTGSSQSSGKSSANLIEELWDNGE